MPDAFVIMQIGNAAMDKVCGECIVPAAEACDLSVKRVDKHNEGALLKSEIVRFIEGSQIIIADLTNERPNCYLEVGYAMGLDKFRNVILTAREDHFPGSPNHKIGGPKIHFDLSGYDILFWDPNDLKGFRNELEKRIRRRLAILEPTSIAAPAVIDADWRTTHEQRAIEGITRLGLRALMTLTFALKPPKPSWNQKELDEAVRSANIHTFGWPIGIHISDSRPRPVADGIVAEVSSKDRPSYDYWALRKNGDFFLLHSLFEDTRDPTAIFFDTRIVRVTETFLFCVRLYQRLKVDPSVRAMIHIAHSGFDGRTLRAANPMRLMLGRNVASASTSDGDVEIALGEIEGQLPELVKKICGPLFMLFDYSEFNDGIYNEIIDKFVSGHV